MADDSKKKPSRKWWKYLFGIVVIVSSVNVFFVYKAMHIPLREERINNLSAVGMDENKQDVSVPQMPAGLKKPVEIPRWIVNVAAQKLSDEEHMIVLKVSDEKSSIISLDSFEVKMTSVGEAAESVIPLFAKKEDGELTANVKIKNTGSWDLTADLTAGDQKYHLVKRIEIK